MRLWKKGIWLFRPPFTGILLLMGRRVRDAASVNMMVWLRKEPWPACAGALQPRPTTLPGAGPSLDLEEKAPAQKGHT